MNEKYINILEELLTITDENKLMKQLSKADRSLVLHFFAANYNWDSGFEVPGVIMNNETCDFGTGLLMFHYADGYRMLEDYDAFLSSPLDEWKDFLSQIYKKLLKHEFKSMNISFDPELTKIQRYKLKKSNPNLADILINRSPGEVFDIPRI